MSPRVVVSIVSLTLVLLMMLGELWRSRRNERILRSRGAIEPMDAVFATMRLAYPGVFVAMALEGALFGPEPGLTTVAGALVFFVSKALKFWAIASLGWRWSYRVLVVPGAPLVTSGPYALMRHPNYVGVVGELIGMALLVGARVTGPLGVLYFGWLLRRRVQAEERALY